MRRKTFMWSLAGVSAALGFMLTVQITSRPNSASNTSGGLGYLDLRTQIQEQVQEHDILTQAISKQAAQLAEYRASQGNAALMEQALKHDEEQVAQAAGLTPVTGQGLTMIIKDDPNLPFFTSSAGNFQQNGAEEISIIVNDLFANGAQAISINGERLVTTSSIREVTSISGISTIQVNSHDVNMPIVIKAVGDPDLMQNVLDANAVKTVLNLWQEDFIVERSTPSHPVVVPAYTGPLPGQWAKEVNSQ